MLRQTSIEDHSPPDGWQTVSIVGGPHHRVRVCIHQGEDEIVLHDGADAHHYYRVNSKAELHHESRVAAVFGKGAKR